MTGRFSLCESAKANKGATDFRTVYHYCRMRKRAPRRKQSPAKPSGTTQKNNPLSLHEAVMQVGDAALSRLAKEMKARQPRTQPEPEENLPP